MINQEIVTYLKSEKDTKKGFALFDKEKKKDKPQYLPYLLIIFYCSKNKTIEGQTKRLIDSLIPKEIVKFQNSFVQKFRLLDNDMKEFQLEMEEDYLNVDDWEFTIDQKDEAKKEIAQISKLSGWADSYLKAFFLPVWLWWFFHPWKNGSHKGTSISKIQLLHAPLVSFYYSDLLEDVGNFEVIEGNKFFLKWILDICENLQKNNSMICDFEEEPYIEIQSSSNCLEFISKTKELKALHFLEKVTRHDKDFDNQDHLACSSETYSEYMEAAEKAVLEFESHLTYEIRLNNQMFEDPGLNEGVAGAIKASDVICITGKLKSFDTKAKAKEHLENLGYEVRSTFTKDVTILLNESGVESGKTKKARDNGVRIVTTIDDLEVEHLPKGENKKSAKKDSSNLDPLIETETSLDEKKIALMKDIKSLDEYPHDDFNKLFRSAPRELKEDRQVFMTAVRKFPHVIEKASERFKDDKEIVMISIKQHGLLLEEASDRLKEDREVVMAAVKSNARALEYASESLRNDQKIVIGAIKKDYLDLDGRLTLRHTSKELRNDKEVLMVAVENEGLALQYASKNLQGDRGLVMTAVKQNGDALRYASEILRRDREVVMAAIKNSEYAMGVAQINFKEDREVIMTAVKHSGKSLSYLSKEFQNDREVVMTAVKQNGDALRYASEILRRDREVVMAAVKQEGNALRSASKKLRDDKEVVIIAVKNYGDPRNAADNRYALEYASKKLQNDREVVIAALETLGYVLQYASKKLQNDREVVMTAVKQHGEALGYVSKKLQNDKEVVMAAVKSNGNVLEYASKELQNDKEIVMIAVKKFGRPLKYASEELQADEELIALAKKHD